MRLLYCIPNLGHGGAERQLSYLAAELQRKGHEVHIASSRGGPNLVRLQSDGVQWHCVGGVSNRDPRIFLRLARLIRKLKPNVVQTILTPMDIMGGAAALITRTPWVLKESSSAQVYARGFRHKLRSALGRRADRIISNSAGGHAYWRSVRGAHPVGVIRNAVPLDEIDRAVSVAFSRSEKVILYAGRLDSGKNVENVIEALSQIRSELPFIALICGDGPRRSHLERMARALGIAHRVVFTGYVSNIWTLMKGADAFVSLSRFEGCPNVVIEAFACGCPMVISDIPAHREILEEHEATFVNSSDPSQVARAIKFAVSDKAARAKACNAPTKAADWTVELTAQLYERVYLDVSTRSGLLPRDAPRTSSDDGKWQLSAN